MGLCKQRQGDQQFYVVGTPSAGQRGLYYHMEESGLHPEGSDVVRVLRGGGGNRMRYEVENAWFSKMPHVADLKHRERKVSKGERWDF